MARPGLEQQFELLAKLGGHADWGALTTEEVQVGITDAQRAGVEFTLFIKNRFRVTMAGLLREAGELTIEIPVLPRPTLAEIQTRWPWVSRIERDTSPTSPVTLRLATVLMPEEREIDSVTYERRLIPHQDSLLGLQHRDWLIAHQDEVPEPARTAVKALLGKVYIDFPGLVVVHGGGGRRFPYAGRDGERWGEGWRWVDAWFVRHGRVALSSK